MNGLRVNKVAAGVVIIVAGLAIFLDNLGIDLDVSDLLPLLLIYFGVRLWNRGRRVWGAILAGVGLQWALDAWLGITFDFVFELVLSLGLIYFGYRLVRSGRMQNGTKSSPSGGSPEPGAWDSAWSKRGGGGAAFAPFRTNMPPSPPGGGDPYTPLIAPMQSRSALIGDFHLTSGRFELRHLHIWHGIGDVVIDLSRAVLAEEETLLVINGWVGGITLYVPVDLAVSVTASVAVGDLKILGHRQGGISRQVSFQSPHYDTASRRVRLILSLIVGDIEVKHI